ncbi:MAG: SHOCT domain-containing protein [Gallionella sp.]|nr:SHOCT domain-containing protein [Gallionella sp.]
MKPQPKKVYLLVAITAAATLSGCASYRTDSNITSAPTSALSSNTNVLILEGVPDREYKEIGLVEVSIKKLTAFHKDPTREQANEALIEKARIIGADAVIKVTYDHGVGFTTWGYIDAKGTGVKLSKNVSISGTPARISETTSQKLRDLQSLRTDGVITEDEFIKKKQQLLEKL